MLKKTQHIQILSILQINVTGHEQKNGRFSNCISYFSNPRRFSFQECLWQMGQAQAVGYIAVGRLWGERKSWAQAVGL